MFGQSKEETQYVQLITRHQRMLYAFIRTMVPDGYAADDILQETNLALWKGIGGFEPDSNFSSFATKVAHRKVIDHVRREGKLGGLIFDSELADQIASRLGNSVDALNSRFLALEACLSKLSESDRDLLRQRYCEKESVRDLSTYSGKSESSLQNHFVKLRKILRDCISRQLDSTA